MQVSWIEPDQLRDLVGQLQRPATPANTVVCELHTLPNPAGAGLGARELGIEEGDLWLPDEQLSSEVLVAPANEAAGELFSPAISAENFRHEAAAPAPQPEQPIEQSAGEPAEQPIEQAKELNRIREKLQAIRERAIEAGLLAHVGVTTEPRVEESPPASQPEPPPAPAAEVSENLLPVSSPFALASPVVESAPIIAGESSSSFEAPQGSLSDRLEAFASWAARQLALNDLLIVDDHGDILWGIHEQAGLVVSAMMACKATLRSTAMGAAGLSSIIEQPISIDRMLIIVPCETSYGTLSIAFVRDGGFQQQDALLLQKALLLAIETHAGLAAAPHSTAALD